MVQMVQAEVTVIAEALLVLAEEEHQVLLAEEALVDQYGLMRQPLLPEPLRQLSALAEQLVPQEVLEEQILVVVVPGVPVQQVLVVVAQELVLVLVVMVVPLPAVQPVAEVPVQQAARILPQPAA